MFYYNDVLKKDQQERDKVSIMTKQSNKEKLAQLEQQVWNEVQNYMADPDEMLEYLTFLKRFPQYSTFNRMLIHAQRPGAVAVASYKKFKEAGYQVQRGEKSLRILAPTTSSFFYRVDNDGKHVTQLKKATAAEKQAIEQGKIKVYTWDGFVPVPVFDVLQTNMPKEEYPKMFPNAHVDYTTSDNYNHDQVLAGVKQVLKQLNVLAYTPSRETWDGGNAKGYYQEAKDGSFKRICMNPNNTPSEDDAVLLHELSHAILHTAQTNAVQQALKITPFEKTTVAERELQAEMSAYLISQQAGIDTRKSTVAYIASWVNQGKQIDQKRLKEFFTEVVKVADYVASVINTPAQVA